MSRFVSSLNQTEAANQDIAACIAVDLDFASGHVRVHDQEGTFQIGGNTYTGLGKFGSIEAVEEDIAVVARPLKMTLSGVDASLISTATTEIYQNRSDTVYACFFNRTTAQLIDVPEILSEGRMDRMTIQLDGDSSRIDLQCESRLRREARLARYTNQYLVLNYSGERFFDLVPTIQGFRGTWGAKGLANDGRNRSDSDKVRDILDRLKR